MIGPLNHGTERDEIELVCVWVRVRIKTVGLSGVMNCLQLGDTGMGGMRLFLDQSTQPADGNHQSCCVARGVATPTNWRLTWTHPSPRAPMTRSVLLAIALAAAKAENGHQGMSHGRRLKVEWPNEPTWQARAIFAERKSPTTDTVSFSPRTWPVANHPWGEPLYKLALVQRACRMTNNDPSTCYTSSSGSTPFTFADSDSKSKKFELYRYARDPKDAESYTTAGIACSASLTSSSETKYIGWGAQFSTADYTNPTDCECTCTVLRSQPV